MRLAIVLVFLLAGPARTLERLGRLDHPPIREASGIVASRRHPGIFWVHNDSGNAPRLFAVRRDGSLVREFAVSAPNVDWEDLAIDDSGHLYLGEIGNNDGRLPLRAIYRLDEPDPSRPADVPLAVDLRTYYRFSRGARFDAEGLFIDDGRAMVVAKTFDRSDAALYRVPLDPPAPLRKPALPEPAGSLPGFVEPATGADLSRDGRFLAVCAHDAARVYERSAGMKTWRLKGAVRFADRHIEAICWDGADLIVAGEDRDVFRIAERVWRAAND